VKLSLFWGNNIKQKSKYNYTSLKRYCPEPVLVQYVSDTLEFTSLILLASYEFFCPNQVRMGLCVLYRVVGRVALPPDTPSTQDSRKEEIIKKRKIKYTIVMIWWQFRKKKVKRVLLPFCQVRFKLE